MSDPADTMRAAADHLRATPLVAVVLSDRIADWLDSAAYDAEMIGPDFRAERAAAAILGFPDPWPDAPPPVRRP